MCSNLLTYYTSLWRGQLCIYRIIVYRKLKRAIKAKSSLCVCVADVYPYNVWQSWTDKPQVGHKTGDNKMAVIVYVWQSPYNHCIRLIYAIINLSEVQGGSYWIKYTVA